MDSLLTIITIVAWIKDPRQIKLTEEINAKDQKIHPQIGFECCWNSDT